MTTMHNDFDGLMDMNFEDDEQSSYNGYPRIWWFNGVKQAGTAGHFYTSENEFSTPLGEPWQKVSRFDDGDGYYTESLKIIPIRKRYQAFMKDARDSKRKIWLEKWTEGASIYTEILCFIEGYPDGLVTIAVKGLTGKAFTNRKDGIFTRFNDTVVAVAKSTMKKGNKLPPFAFWIPITGLKSNGRVKYEDTGHGSFVTPPTLDLPSEVTRDTAKALYVGKEMLDYCHQAWKEHAEWRLQQRTNEIATVPAAEPAKNVPSQVSEKDLYEDDNDIF